MMKLEELKNARQWITYCGVLSEFPSLRLGYYPPFAIVKAFFMLKALQEKHKVKKVVDKVDMDK